MTMTTISLPSPNPADILNALGALFDPADVIELRALHRTRKRTDAGYFDGQHRDDLASHAARLSAQGAAVYVTLNPVEPQLLNRYFNRMQDFADATTTDPQITRRRWLLVDLDPVRPAKTSATAAQLEAAHAKAVEVRAWLKTQGWPSPVVALSGNGYHLLYAIDFANEDEATALVKSALIALADRFDDARTKVDRSVFNAARITKLYGTLACKGDNTPQAPWRLSALLKTPARVLVTPEQLKALAPVVEPAQQNCSAPDTSSRTKPLNGSFSLEDFLAMHGIDYTADMHGGSDRFKLAVCPFNPEHGKGEAAVFRQPSGAMGFKCQHDSCSGKDWRDVRDLLDGPRTAHHESDALAPPLDADIARYEARHASQPLQAVPAAWPEPSPLPDALPPVQAFDADLLPVALRGWVMDIAHRMQCPADFPAVAALVALSSLIGARAVIQPKVRDDWRVVPNLWGMAIGRVGVKKSPALSEALTLLNRLQADEFELHEGSHDAWELDCKVSSMQDADNEKKAKGLAGKNPAAARALLEPMALPAEPIVRRFIVNDATVEKLGELMKENPWGTLSYRDEIYGLLTSLDKPGQEGARTFMLQSYDGNQGYVFDRILRGTINIPRVCQAVIGGIQPGRIQEYVRRAVAGGSADDGLLQRFGMAVWPDIDGPYLHVDEWPDTPAKQAAWAVFERLAALQPASNTEPTVWHFDNAAQALFVEWLIPFENEIRGDDLHPAMVSHLSKYRKLIPALALIFAIIDTPDSGGVIREPELLRALAWGEYLRTHANRLYAAAVTPETTGAAALLAKIKAGKLADKDGVPLNIFTPRQVAIKHWAGLDTPDAVRKAADLLTEFDWLWQEVVPSGVTGGRSSDRYTVNPLARGAA